MGGGKKHAHWCVAVCSTAHFCFPSNSVPHVVQAGSCSQKIDRHALHTNLQAVAGLRQGVALQVGRPAHMREAVPPP